MSARNANRLAVSLLLFGALLYGYWTTNRMDPFLVNLGLNHSNCYQLFGSSYCGEDAVRIKERLSK